MKEELYWIWLSRIEGLGPVRKNKLLELYKTPKEIWKLKKQDLIKIQGIGEELSEKIIDEKYRANLEKYLEYMQKNEIHFVTIYDKEYPQKLKKIYDPPVVLFYKGNNQIFNSFSLSIIGCRDCSNYGIKVAQKIAYELTKKGIIIVSGLAKGIDTNSHIGCLKAQGKTIGIIGNGLDNIYPYENKNLANEIIKKQGAIISEYIIGTKPDKRNFPARNRIISGMTDGVIVIEAKEKSGTLITVDFALEQGKNVYVVPGNIDAKNSVGTNDLIKQGAKMITRIEDIIEDFS